MKRITQTIRDEAALVCALSASEVRPADECPCTYCIGARVGVSFEAQRLAKDAWFAAEAEPGENYYAERYAEAEAMLRTGWTP
jgi:hypothetical protein